VSDRAVYGTRKHRAADLTAGDVTRNKYGKWDVVTDVKVPKGARYAHVVHEAGGETLLRTVALVDVQVVKPS
jgi:hypothetical protein